MLWKGRWRRTCTQGTEAGSCYTQVGGVPILLRPESTAKLPQVTITNPDRVATRSSLSGGAEGQSPPGMQMKPTNPQSTQDHLTPRRPPHQISNFMGSWAQSTARATGPLLKGEGSEEHFKRVLVMFGIHH